METVFRKEIKYLISRREAMILQQNLDGMYEKRKIRLRIYSLNDLSAKLEFQ